MRFALAGALLASLALVACDDGEGGDVASDAAATSSTTTTAQASAAAERPATDDLVEVTGIVGAVDTARGTIAINRLSGADVDQVHVDSGTRIRTAAGAALRLLDIRPSDRIIATGVVDESAGVLAAREIRVGSALDGSEGG